jgi:hypothetical protein
MTDDIIDGSDLLPQPTIKETLGRMARVVAFDTEDYKPGAIDPETAEPYPPAPVLRQRSVSAAFDMGTGADAPYPRPEPAKSRITPSRRKGGRPAGAEELQKLFAAGMIMVIAFSAGEWAQPTPEEANELAAPLGNILARRVDVAAKLGADANDTIAFVVALMAYTVRVGPVAAGKAREALDERNARSRVERVTRAPDNRGEGRMAPRQDAPASSRDGETYSAEHVTSAIRANAIGILDRNFGHLSGPDPSVAAG